MTDEVPFPVYHGTSTIFLPSIFEAGLGGRNPVAECRGVQCLDRLVNIADVAFQNSDEWSVDRIGLDLMRRQTITGANMNFRHGGAYVTPAETTAVGYALSNEVGSELLSECIKLYRRIATQVASEVLTLRDEFRQVFDLSLGIGKPVLIRIIDLPRASIQTEQAGDANVPIDELLNLEPGIRAIAAQQSNFELLLPHRVDPSQVWLIKPLPDCPISSSSYKLEPYGTTVARSSDCYGSQRIGRRGRLGYE